MPETKKEIKKSPKKNTYKAVNPDEFKSNFNESMLYYEKFSSGESVECDETHKQFKYLLINNFIIRE
tara:strand:- start:1287 stop:1487 length:201 start_codon:yes stop_codon:yes gene_type:complete